MPFTYPYPRPSVTLDIAFFALGTGAPKVLLIQRSRGPYRGKWALPGGFLDMDEDLETGARRELMEETNTEVGACWQVGTFGAVDRDPRGRTVTVAFVATHIGAPPEPRSGDDASDARWHSLRRLPPLAFDHPEVVRQSRRLLAERAQKAEVLATLLPKRFATQELQTLHEFAAGSEAKSSFASSARQRSILRPTTQRRGRSPLYQLANRAKL